MSKTSEVKAPTLNDRDVVEQLELMGKMILPRDQKNRYWPDHNPTSLSYTDGRPINFWDKGGEGHTFRNTTLIAPKGVGSAREVRETPQMFFRVQKDPLYRSRITDFLKVVAHDLSWFQLFVVTFADADRVEVMPQGTQFDLKWPAQPSAVKAA
jgi:hypothetical protein